MVRLQILVTQEQYDMLREKSFKECISISKLIRDSLIPPKPISEEWENGEKISGKIPKVNQIKLPNGDILVDDYYRPENSAEPQDLSSEFHPMPKGDK